MPAHTHSCLCVCVCQRLFWPLTTSTFLSCVFDSTLSPDRTCRLLFFLKIFSRTFQERLFPQCSCCLWIMNQSHQYQQETTGRGLFMIYCIVNLRLLKKIYIDFSFQLDTWARNRMSASENVEEHISLWENLATLRCLIIWTFLRAMIYLIF